MIIWKIIEFIILIITAIAAIYSSITSYKITHPDIYVDFGVNKSSGEIVFSIHNLGNPTLLTICNLSIENENGTTYIHEYIEEGRTYDLNYQNPFYGGSPIEKKIFLLGVI